MASKPARLFLSPPHMSGRELALIEEAFASNYIAPLGPMVDAFEREFAAATGIAHALALASGTAALHLALRILGVGPGDRVICSTLTFIGNVAPVLYLGAEPVLLDVDPTTWTLDPALLEAELERAAAAGELPKMVLPTDLYGQCADLDAIQELCAPHGIAVVDDAAEALGARYRGRAAGQGALAAAYSFNGNKIITTSGGGMLVTENARWAEQARHLATQARDPALHYEHSQIGYNYRLSNLLAAVGRGQLEVLNDRAARRRANFAFYRRALADMPGVEWMPEASFGRATRWLTCLLIDPELVRITPIELCSRLASENIEARPMWKPMHLQSVFADCRVRGGAVAEDIFRRGLCLPSGSNLIESDLQRVANGLRRLLRGDVEKAA